MGTMFFEQVLERFVDQRPVAVMARVVLERQLSAEFFDDTFAAVAQEQYVRDLTFSSCAKLLAQVTLGTAASVHAAFRKERDTIPVTVTAVYDKLQRVEPRVCEALVQRSGADLSKVLAYLAKRRRPVPGYRLRIVDGNVLAGTEHRLKELRHTGAAALPGQSLVLYDYDTNLITGLLACEDGHANERRLVKELLQQVQAGDLIMGDCNFCTLDMLTGVAERRGCFLIRHHKGSALRWLGQRQSCGRGCTGRIFEQAVCVSDGITCRALIIKRDRPLRDGSQQVILLTNVPAQKATACTLAELYLQRWTIEEAFRQLTQYLSCEVTTLGYPKAALFAFTLAVLAYNALACMKAALAKAHPEHKWENWSSYYLAWELKVTFDGLLVALPAEEWLRFADTTAPEFAQALLDIAQHAAPQRYAKSKRGPKKPVERQKVSRGSHVSTAKILQKRKLHRRPIATTT